MPIAPRLANFWKTLFHKERIEKDLSDELQAYVDELTERKIHAGMAPDLARRQALIEVGGMEQTRELVRETRVGFGLDLWLKDIVYALRGFRRTPGFILVIAMTLALGIGAVTSVFSVVDAALLRKLAVDEPDELVLIGHSGDLNLYSYAEFENVRMHVQTLANAFAFAPFPQAVVDMDGQRSRVTGQLVSGNYYSELGVGAFAGRTLTEDDDRSAAEPTAVISYRYWERRFNKDPNVIGKKGRIGLRQDAEFPVTIVGVSAPDFNGTSGFGISPDFSLARSAAIQQDGEFGDDDPGGWGEYKSVYIMGRRATGMSRQQITAEIRAKRWSGIALPESMEALPGARGAVSPAVLVGGQRRAPVLPLLAAAFALLLLIGCVNVSNLLFSRSITRRREIGIRWVLGAGRSRLIRQLLTETVMLSFLGGAIGIFFAYLSQDLLVMYVGSLLGPNPATLGGELVADLNVNASILAFTAGVSLLTGILFGLALAVRTSKMDLHAAIKDGGPNLSYTRSRLRKTLLIAQVAMSLVLVMSGSVFFRTLHDRFRVDPGFDTSHLIILGNSLPKRPTKDLWNLYYKDVLDMVRTIPGVASATLWTQPRNQPLQRGNVFLVEPGFFKAMGIPLLSGRDFTADDKLAEPRVAIISERRARRLFPNKNPLGEDVPGQERRTTIIGISKEVQFHPVPDRTVDHFQLHPIGGPGERAFVEVRSVGDPKALLAPLQQSVSALNPAAQVFAVKYRDLWETNMATLYAPEIALSGALNVFAVVALFMISVGLYGITAYNVACRTGEIGIRMALGARRRAIVWLVQKEMLGIVAAGTVVGLAISVPLMMLIRRGIFGLAPEDSAALAFAVLAVIGVAGLAAWLPTRRATRVDPMVSLRME